MKIAYFGKGGRILSVRNKNVLRYLLAILLVLQTFNLGGIHRAVASGVISVTVQNPDTSNALVIESAAATLDTAANEAIVTVTLKNNKTTDSVAGFVATGFDASGKAIETNTYFLDNGWGTPKKILAGASQQQTLRLKAGSQMASVTVSPLGMHNDVRILSSAYRVDGGNVIASAVVGNATTSEKMAGVLAEAKNADGSNFQVKTVTPVNFGPAPIKPLAAVRLELVFEGAAAGIHNMDFALTGVSTGIELLSTGSQKVNGQWIVTGVAENGSSVDSTVGFTVTGYDEHNLPVETATDFSRDSFGATQVKPHVPVGLKAVLTAGDKIKRIETKVTGISQGKELLSFGVNNVGDTYKITGVVENGTDVASELELIARSYNYSGELIEQKRVKTEGFFEDERIIPPHAPALLSTTLNDANVEKIVIDTPEKIDSTENIIFIVDQKAPFIKSSISAQNVDVQGKLSLTFNENVVKDAGFEGIKLVSDSGAEAQIEPSINGNILTITLKEILDLGSSYSLKIPGNALKDQAGNSLSKNLDFPFQTKVEAGNVGDFIIVKNNETWGANHTFEQSVIVPPNTVFTVPDGATFLKDLIVYGSLQPQGSFTVKGTWYQGYGFKVPPVTISSHLIDAEGNFKVKGKTVPGFVVNAGEVQATADAEGYFELIGSTTDGVVLIEVKDNFNNSYPAKKLQYDPVSEELQAKIEEAIAAINAIPSLLTLADGNKVTAARERVNAALQAGADEAQISNLSTLIEAENKLEELKTSKAEAVKAAIDAIEALPEVDKVTLADETRIKAARELVSNALKAGAVESDLTNLDKLVALEEKLAQLAEAKRNAIEDAIAAIEKLPSEGELTLADKEVVEQARALVETAFVAGASQSEISNLSILIQAEIKLEELKTMKTEAIKAAIEAIEALPEEDTVTLADEPRIKAARELVSNALKAGAVESDLTNLNKLVDLEERIAQLAETKRYAIEDAIAAIENLPSEGELTLADKEKVEQARAMVEKAFTAGASESEITNLDKLINLEEMLKSLAFKQQVIDDAIEAITNLPDVETVKLADQSGVMMARQLVDRAFELGAMPEEVTNLNKLILLEERLSIFQDIEEAVVAAESAIAALPHIDSIKLSDEPAVLAARELVNQALEKGAIESDINDLYKLTQFESRLDTMKATLKKVMDAIDALPSVEELTWEDESKVISARELVYEALMRDISKEDIPNINKLILLEKRLAELKVEKQQALEEAIQAAETAIAGLPSVEELRIADEAAVIEAKKLVEYALSLGAGEHSITNWDKLGRLEDKLQDLKNERHERTQEAIAAIKSLPDTDKITLKNQEIVAQARKRVNQALEAEASESDITNLAKLIAIEERLAYLEANKDVTAPSAPIVYEVTDFDIYVRGKAEPGSVISVKIGKTEIASGVTKADGTFAVMVPAYFTPGYIINVTATDEAGNVSPTTTVVSVKVMNGWRNTLGTWYYIQSGQIATGWKYIGYKWYHFSPWGAMETGWLQDNNKWYYLSENGHMVTGWLEWNKKWYYLDGGGIMKTGWVKSGGSWYYLASSGIMQTGWIKSGEKWYYLASSGVMKTGWVKDGRNWYYLASSGIMQTGWIQSGGKWYYLYSSGVMAHSTTIGGYKLGADGAWIR
jgi:glucan-binding YG repeat protein